MIFRAGLHTKNVEGGKKDHRGKKRAFFFGGCQRSWGGTSSQERKKASVGGGKQAGDSAPSGSEKKFDPLRKGKRQKLPRRKKKRDSEEKGVTREGKEGRSSIRNTFLLFYRIRMEHLLKRETTTTTNI